MIPLEKIEMHTAMVDNKKFWLYWFNREESDYQSLLNQCGFEQSSKLEFDYQYYENTKISFLLYEKNKP